METLLLFIVINSGAINNLQTHAMQSPMPFMNSIQEAHSVRLLNKRLRRDLISLSTYIQASTFTTVEHILMEKLEKKMVTLTKPSKKSYLSSPPKQPQCKEVSECYFLKHKTQT